MGKTSNGDDDNDEQGRTLNVVQLHPDPWLAPTWLPTGEAVVDVFKQRRGGEFAYVDALGEMFHWTGQVWERDQCRTLEREIAALCRTIGASKKKTARAKLESAGFINGCVGRMRAEAAHTVELFDQAPVLNMSSAYVKMDGSTIGPPLPQRREDYCSKMCGVTAVAGPHPLWDAFLKQITADNQDKVDYLQRLAGYCASPYTSEQAFFFHFGEGGNGKGAFWRTIAFVLGDYTATASLDLFLATKFEQHPEELASLRGVRLVLATETEAGRSWNEAKIKALTGGDRVRARFMRQNSFEYDPQFKIVILGNEQPKIKDTGPALRRRLQLMLFDVMIEPDDKLEHRMRAEEGPQILAWVLEGFDKWRQHGLAPPQEVVAATDEYFAEQDVIGQWLAECIDTSRGWTPTAELFANWKTWAEANGETFVGTQAWLTRKLKKKFPQPDDTNTVRPRIDSKRPRSLFGIRLIDDAAKTEPDLGNGHQRGHSPYDLADERDAEIKAPSGSRLQTLSHCDEACRQCGLNDGQVYLIKNNSMPGVVAQPLHQQCASFWFKTH